MAEEIAEIVQRVKTAIHPVTARLEILADIDRDRSPYAILRPDAAIPSLTPNTEGRIELTSDFKIPDEARMAVETALAQGFVIDQNWGDQDTRDLSVAVMTVNEAGNRFVVRTEDVANRLGSLIRYAENRRLKNPETAGDEFAQAVTQYSRDHNQMQTQWVHQEGNLHIAELDSAGQVAMIADIDREGLVEVRVYETKTFTALESQQAALLEASVVDGDEFRAVYGADHEIRQSLIKSAAAREQLVNRNASADEAEAFFRRLAGSHAGSEATRQKLKEDGIYFQPGHVMDGKGKAYLING